MKIQRKKSQIKTRTFPSSIKNWASRLFESKFYYDFRLGTFEN